MLDSSSLDEVTRLFDARGPDGLTRWERQKRMSGGYNKAEFLLDKFLGQRRRQQQQELKHEHILDLGDVILRKLEHNSRATSAKDLDSRLKHEVKRMEMEVEEFKKELRRALMAKFEEEREAMKKNYEDQMMRIEKQRDLLEEERMKDLIRKMNEECEIALKKQWMDAEELRIRSLKELREEITRKAMDEARLLHAKAIQEALEKAEIEFLKREQVAIERTRQECQREYDAKLKEVRDTYDASIEALLHKLKESDEKYQAERNTRTKIETDFRLLQTDYRRFMNYTDHYHSDYMLKLRHIGSQILQDSEYENKLDDQLNKFNLHDDELPRLPKPPKSGIKKKTTRKS